MGRTLCGCGCGTEMNNPKRLFIQGHDAKTKPAHLTLEARGMTSTMLANELARMCDLLHGEPEKGWETWRRLGVMAIEQSIRLARRGVAP
jgi:hypothetical protein